MLVLTAAKDGIGCCGPMDQRVNLPRTFCIAAFVQSSYYAVGLETKNTGHSWHEFRYLVRFQARLATEQISSSVHS